MRTKWIVISGGVLSGLGKGIVSASIGRLLKPYKIVTVKCDGYLNIDPGTMNPIEHGEVFVLDDGGEVDMDFGHYERFLRIKPKFSWNITSGKIYKEVIDKERRGEYLGKTVQMIPHVTNEIKKRFRTASKDAEIVIIEIGGTAGDMENRIFFEAVRQMKLEKEDILFVHLTYVPFIESVGELKTKPTQQSVTIMMQMGIIPDIIIGRSPLEIDDKSKEKIALFCNVEKDAVISDPNISFTYELPLVFENENLHKLISKKLEIQLPQKDMTRWKELIDNLHNPKREVNIAIYGKYTTLKDSYVSVVEALLHASAHLKVKVNLKWFETTDKEHLILEKVDGIIVPGGFGKRGIEGKIKAIKYARENNVPFLGLCLGMQLAVVEFARDVCKMDDANSTEFDTGTKHPVIDLLPEQIGIKNMGGTMRLGGYDVYIKEHTLAFDIFRKERIRRRFRHRYEVNPEYVDILERAGLIFSGSTKDGKIKQLIELKDHKFFMASQFHPEFTSSLEEPDEMFYNFVKATLKID